MHCGCSNRSDSILRESLSELYRWSFLHRQASGLEVASLHKGSHSWQQLSPNEFLHQFFLSLLTLTTIYILHYLKGPSILKLVLNYCLWKPICGGLSPTHMGPWYLPHLCFSWSRGQPEEPHSNILWHKWKWNFFGMAFIVMMPGVHHNQHYKGNTKGSNNDLPFIVKHDLGVSTFCVYKMTRFTL